MRTDSDPVLEVSNFTKIYPDGTLAVDGIDFTVDRGDFCVLIGPSGCGKSTTLHSIVGNVEPTDGTIVLDGEEITTTPTHEKDIGLVFQDFQLFPHLTARENIEYGLERVGLPPTRRADRLEEVVELMDLEPLLSSTPSELSAGQRQRVALARSVVLRPKLLLLDEPLGDMDYKLQKRMEQELLRIHRELDTTFVYVTHDQTQAMRLADQIIVMNDGLIEQVGSADDVYNHPKTAFVATFVGDSNTFRGRITDVLADEEHVALETPYGEFVASAANLVDRPDEYRGERIPFAVRPHVIDVDDERRNTVTGSVQNVITHPGKGTQLIVTVAGDGETTEVTAKLFGDPSTEVGSKVTLGWDPDATILLEEHSVVDDIDLATDILGE